MRSKFSFCSLLGAMAALWSVAPSAQAQKAPTNAQLIDKILATAKPGAKFVLVDDMWISVAELKSFRNSGAGASGGKTADSVFVRNATLWPGGNVAYIFDASISPRERAFFTAAARELETIARLKFSVRTTETDYIKVITEGDANNSPIGRIGGEQILRLSVNSNKYVAAHEIMHALGIHHEQVRSDRDTYVTIDFTNIQAGKEGNFAILPPDLSNNRGPYDFDSVMHYGSNFFANDPNKPNIIVKAPNQRFQNTIGQSSFISESDKKGLQDMYGPLGPIIRPSNDLFAKAQVLAGSAGSVDGTNKLATVEVGEPISSTSIPSASVWYRWTPANNGTVTINTLGSGFDTNLAVFVGPSLQTLTPVTANDDAVASASNPNPGPTSSVTFPAQANVNYYISVDGTTSFPNNISNVNKSGDTGNFKLNWNQDVNASRSTLSGKVLLGSQGLSGVVITLSGADANNATTSGTATTNSAGEYSIAGLLAGTYSLRPVRPGYTFAPNPRTVKVNGASTGNNFTATQIPESLLPGLSVSDVSIREGKANNSVITFNITLSAPSKDNVTVSYATANGAALAGNDYDATKGTLTFAPGVTTLTVSVRIRPDSVVEPDENFFLKINTPIGAKIVDEMGIGTIVNDDAASTQ